MDQAARLTYCKVCLNREFDVNQGLLCGLTHAKATFETSCPDFKIDEAEAERKVALEKSAQEEAPQGFFAQEQKGIQKGVVGGILMVVIAVVWFFGGLAFDRIFFYPPILLIIGVYAIVKGIADKNMSGKKE